MPSSFWSNTVWFALLSIGTLAELLIICVKVPAWKPTIALYFAVCGMAFAIEATICCFLKSYDYYPMVFPQSPYDDSIAGNLFSQFSVVASAFLMPVLKLKKRWIIVFAAGYCLIEEAFLRLGIYSHNWYRTWMTFGGLILLFSGVRILYYGAYEKKHTAIRYAYILFGLFTLDVPIIKWTFKLTGILLLNLSVLPDGLSSYALLILANLIILSSISMTVYFNKLKPWWKASLLVLELALLYGARAAGFIGTRPGWFPIYAAADIGAMLLFIFILDRFFGSRIITQ